MPPTMNNALLQVANSQQPAPTNSSASPSPAPAALPASSPEIPLASEMPSAISSGAAGSATLNAVPAHNILRSILGGVLGGLGHAAVAFKKNAPKVLSTVSRVVPDVAAAMPADTPIGGAMRQAGQTVQAERALRTEQQQRDQQFSLSMARGQMDLLHTQQLIRDDDEKTKDQSATAGRQFVASLEQAGQSPIATNLTSDDLAAGVASGKFDWSKDAAIHVGNIPEFDSKGNEIGVRAIYSVYPLDQKQDAARITLDDSQAAFLAANGFPSVVAGGRLSQQDYYHLFNSASKVQATRARAAADLADYDLKLAETDEKKQTDNEKIAAARAWDAFAPYMIASGNDLAGGMTRLAMTAAQRDAKGSPAPQAIAARQLYGQMLSLVGPKNLNTLIKKTQAENDTAIKKATKRVATLASQLSEARKEVRGKYDPITNANLTPDQFIERDADVTRLQSQLSAAQGQLNRLQGIKPPSQEPMVRMKLPDGRTGVIPQSKVDDFLKAHPGSQQVSGQ